MLKEQKNERVPLTSSQEHPNTALAEDFHVGKPGDSLVPGCYGDLTPAQYAAVLKESSEATSTKPAQTGKFQLADHPKRP